MENQELVNELRNLLPPKVDYAKLVGAESFSHGCCYVWEDPEPYIIENAANVIESQQAEIDRLKHENEQLRELVRLEIGDLSEACNCEYCANIEGCNLNQRDCESWQWKHTDKVRLLK